MITWEHNTFELFMGDIRSSLLIFEHSVVSWYGISTKRVSTMSDTVKGRLIDLQTLNVPIQPYNRAPIVSYSKKAAKKQKISSKARANCIE